MMLAMLFAATQSIRVTADGSWRLVGISTFSTFTTFTSCPAAPPHPSLLFALLSSFQYKHQHQHQPIPSISPHWLLHFCILAVVYYLSVFVLKPKNFSHLCHPPNYSLPFAMFAFPIHSCEYFYEPNIFWKPIWPTDHWTLDTSCLLYFESDFFDHTNKIFL